MLSQSIRTPRRHGATFAAAACGLILAFAVSPSRAASFDEVRPMIIKACGQANSYTATMETKMDMAMGEGNSMKSETAGKMMWRKKGETVCYRMESKTKSVTKMQGNETKQDSKTLSVCDGKFIYTLTDDGTNKMAMKMKVEPDKSYDTESAMKAWEKNYDLKVLDDEKVDGVDCWVVEATPKKAAQANAAGKMRQWYRKDCGITAKVVSFGPDGKPLTTTLVKDVKLNVDIPDEKFKFKAPEGVTVMDMTKNQPPQASDSDDASDKPAKKSKPEASEDAPKKEKADDKDDKATGAKNLIKRLF
ncbi:MAG: outer membrane lipoprotein carrier protein LolA [Phycisphaerae bacterium]|nr:outer membrane lipoprotein carrier protein LolA [Phycisphaerae bacterium]